jgi:alginate O-acetyltransferase complex protein AlgI
LVIVMFLGGLWHGAAWTFVAWGLLHGLYLVLERVLAFVFKGAGVFDTTPGRLLLGLLTFAAVCLGWVFFRAQDFGSAARLLHSMFGLTEAGAQLLSTRELIQVALVMSLTLLVHWKLRDRTIEEFASNKSPWVLGLGWAFMACAIILSRGISNVFIYFQF